MFVGLDRVGDGVDDDVGDVVVLERIVGFAADPIDSDEVESTEEFQVLGHQRLGQSGRLDDVRDGGLAVVRTSSIFSRDGVASALKRSAVSVMASR